MLKRSIAVLVLSLLLPLALPSAAQTQEKSSCPASVVPNAGYLDVGDSNPHKADIDCIWWWNITDKQGYFSPAEPLPRWEMALWLSNAANWLQWLPSGDTVTFSDTGSLHPEVQRDVEQIKKLGVTQGVAPGVYDPYGAVPRWQMALFLTRFVHATGRQLPLGNASAFTDLAGLSPEASAAVGQLAEMGITKGTTPTTFSPYDTVTREQMASFVARAFEYGYAVNSYATSCTDEPEGYQYCTGDFHAVPSPNRVRLRDVWAFDKEFDAELVGALFDGTVSTDIYIDGVYMSTQWYAIELPGVAYRFTEVVLDSAMGSRHVEYYSYVGDTLIRIDDHTVVFDGA